MKARKAIYFPTGYEAGMERGRPVVIWVVKAWPDGAIHFARHEDEVDSGRYSSGRANRAVPFSELLWRQVRAYLGRLDAVEDEYRRLERHALRHAGAKWFLDLRPRGLFD